MANKNLFGKSTLGKLVPETGGFNRAGGPAYQLPAKAALAQYVITGCLNQTFYASAEEQLDQALILARACPLEFVAKAAIYASSKGHMKDFPVLLVAHLLLAPIRTTISVWPGLVDRTFKRVIRGGKELRAFCQMVRSGRLAKKSFGYRPKKLVREWFAERTTEQIVEASVGQDPRLGDVVRIVHPKPANPERAALYEWLMGKESKKEDLPTLVKAFEAFKGSLEGEMPPMPFRLLTGLPLKKEHWKEIVRYMTWQATRINLNAMARHGVFEDPAMVTMVADRLKNAEKISLARVFPYQLLVAYRNCDAAVPAEVKEALQEALDTAVANIPAYPGLTAVCVDCSGSMDSPVTGERGRGATTTALCRDVAGLFAAAIWKKNPGSTVVLAFATHAVHVQLNPRDSVLTGTKQISEATKGGTDCSQPLLWLKNTGAAPDQIIYLSDNESWADFRVNRGTASMQLLRELQKRKPGLKVVAVDLQPNDNSQFAPEPGILNVGGFSDRVFNVVNEFLRGAGDPDVFVRTIEEVEV